MKILLDENMPYKLLFALREEGHETESIHSLKLTGIRNGELYQLARDQFDLLFTKDVGFNEWAKGIKEKHHVNFVFVILPQKSQDLFVHDFMGAFRKTDWTRHLHAASWPA